jgi:hypothetical protein
VPPNALHFTGETRSGSSGASAGFAAEVAITVQYGYASPPLMPGEMLHLNRPERKTPAMDHDPASKRQDLLLTARALLVILGV